MSATHQKRSRNFEQYQDEYNALYGDIESIQEPENKPDDADEWLGKRVKGRNLFMENYKPAENFKIASGYLDANTSNIKTKEPINYKIDRANANHLNWKTFNIGGYKTMKKMKNGWGKETKVKIDASPQMQNLIDIVADYQMSPKYHPNLLTIKEAEAYASQRPGWGAFEKDITGPQGRPDGVDEVFITDSNGNIKVINGWGLKDSDYGLRKVYRQTYNTPDTRRQVPYATFKKRYNMIAPAPDADGNFEYEMPAGQGWKHFRPSNITPRKYFAQYIFKPAYNFFYTMCQFHPDNPWVGQLKSLSYNVALTQAFYGFFIPTFVDNSYKHNNRETKERNKWMKDNKKKLMAVLPKFVQNRDYMIMAMRYILEVLEHYWEVQEAAGKLLDEDVIFASKTTVTDGNAGTIYDRVYKDVMYAVANTEEKDRSQRISNYAPDYPEMLKEASEYQSKFGDIEGFKTYINEAKYRPKQIWDAYDARATIRNNRQALRDGYENPFGEQRSKPTYTLPTYIDPDAYVETEEVNADDLQAAMNRVNGAPQVQPVPVGQNIDNSWDEGPAPAPRQNQQQPPPQLTNDDEVQALQQQEQALQAQLQQLRAQRQSRTTSAATSKTNSTATSPSRRAPLMPVDNRNGL